MGSAPSNELERAWGSAWAFEETKVGLEEAQTFQGRVSQSGKIRHPKYLSLFLQRSETCGGREPMVAGCHGTARSPRTVDSHAFSAMLIAK
ncbi:MAG: hypothetical protein AUH11_17995 [Acidobacteria bacterium 13_2_20CM_57_17]|nr:MAG: hypothetical protein AUH11_17995 [Acidobacteria bacterium 13_2_20CM_57_17]OLE16125.1 MAG: hypothetical protein AUG83_04250 [Acidobacteria bacterium 13_1_20CM_4_57_11]